MAKGTGVLEQQPNESGLNESGSSSRKGEVRLQDIARHLGVHPMTVSRALSGRGGISKARCESIRRAAEELGYRPNLAARSLRQGRNLNLIPLFSAYLDSGMNTQKLEAIQSLLGTAGYETPIHSCGFHNQIGPLQVEMLVGLRSQRPAAFICHTSLLSPAAREELRSWSQDGSPVIIYDHEIDIDCDRVIFDRKDAGYQSALHLLELGHTRIGYAHHSVVYGQDERLMGLKLGLLENGVTLRREWVFQANEPVKPTAGGRILAAEFLALPVQQRPTALCFVNDLAAMAFMAEMQKHGVSVPGDLSIVAHDDQPFAEFAATPLTVLTHPAQEIARQVVQVLRQRLDDPKAPHQRVVVRGELIKRASTTAFI